MALSKSPTQPSVMQKSLPRKTSHVNGVTAGWVRKTAWERALESSFFNIAILLCQRAQRQHQRRQDLALFCR
jgi:hypothetical protein